MTMTHKIALGTIFYQDLASPERLEAGRRIRHNNRAHELELMPP